VIAMTLDISGGELWERFAAATLATWRIAHLLAYEDGPWDVLFRLRAWLGYSLWGKLIDCFNCLSIWVAALFVPVVTVRFPEAALIWVALSGAACLLERSTAPSIQIDRSPPNPQQ
jgi:hypothetical protein